MTRNAEQAARARRLAREVPDDPIAAHLLRWADELEAQDAADAVEPAAGRARIPGGISDSI
jgi:hypothetical protein